MQVSGTAIMRFDVATGRWSQLIAEPGYQITSASWSPDGENVVFTDGRCVEVSPCNALQWRVRVLRVRDRNVRTVKSFAAAWTDEASWAPRGGHIAYRAFSAFTPTLPPVIVDEIHVLSVNGSRHRVIGHGFQLAWHPSGKRITYRAAGSLLTSDLRGVPNRTTPIGFTGGLPAWSPDGRTVAFVGGPTLGGSDVYVSGHDRQPRSLGFSSDNASWSPDSRALAVATDRAVAVVDVATGGRRALSIEGYRPAWSPSGTLIAAARDGFIRVADAATGAAVVSFHSGSVESLSWRPR